MRYLGASFTPKAVTGLSKYSNKGGCDSDTFKRFTLSGENRRLAAEIVNFGLAKNTWSTYNTAGRLLAMCSKQEGLKMEFPLTENDIVTYILWLITERKAKATTISGYLAGLRQLHITKGIELPLIRTETVKRLLTGKKNIDNIESRRGKEKKRLPMTMNMMRLLKECIREWEAPMEKNCLCGQFAL